MPSASQAPCALHSVVGLKVQRAVTLGIEGESTFICVLTCALTQNYSVIFKECGTLICPRCWTFRQFPVVMGTDIIPGGKGFLRHPTASGSGSRLGGVILGCMWAGFRAHGSPAGPPGKEESVSASLAPVPSLDGHLRPRAPPYALHVPLTSVPALSWLISSLHQAVST